MSQTHSHFYSAKKPRSGSIKAHSVHIKGLYNGFNIPRFPNNICSIAATPAANWAQESRSFTLVGHAVKSAYRAHHSPAMTEIFSSRAVSADAVNHLPGLLFVRMKPRENFKMLQG